MNVLRSTPVYPIIVYLRRLAQQENQPRAPVHNVDLDNMSYEQILQLQVIF
eukprot:UN20578